MLDERRKHYVTASQAYRVMAGFEAELAGKSMEKPVRFKDLADHCKAGKPKVGDLKTIGITATGKEIDTVYKYIKATEPVFSDGMLSVAREIAMGHFLEKRDEQFLSKDMERGNVQEGEAMLVLSEKTGVDFICTGADQVFFHNDHLGVTPDGVEYKDFDVVSCAEVKNPKDTTHMKYLCTIRGQGSMLKICPEYYWQAQSGLAVTGADAYHWASYHNGFIYPLKMLYVKIEPVPEHIAILQSRAKKVIEAVPDIINDFKEEFFIER